MRISLPPPTPEYVRRLEASAAARPQLYRLRLLMLAVAGDTILTFVRVFPFAAPIALGALFVNNMFIGAVATLAIVLLIWMTRPGYSADGKCVERHGSPELYAALDDLRAKLDVGPRLDVRLDDEFNAGAREARGLFGVIGNRRVLTIGVPLLALLGEAEIRAVIAHEFGHFSRRHGRFGHWLYQAHLGWLSHAEQIDSESSMLDRAGARFAESFVPAFNRRAMVWSRRCEYEADTDAARAVGGEALVSALARLDLFDRWLRNVFPRTVRDWQCSEPMPPEDFLERMIAEFDKAPSDELATIEARESSRAGDDWRDTHPRLAERAAALGVQPSLISRAGLAGSVLFGELWRTVAADYNSRWRKEQAVAWSAAYARYRLIEAPLLEAEPEAVANWPFARRLERAKALRKFEPARGLTELGTLQAAAVEDPDVAFAYAAARLAEGDATGVKAMRAIAQADTNWRAAACDRLVRYYDRIGDHAAAHRWASLLERTEATEMRACQSVCSRLVSGECTPTTRQAQLIEVLRVGLAAEPAVVKAWLVKGEVSSENPLGAERKADALILVIDPFDAMQQPYDVDIIKARHQRVLNDLIEPNALTVAISFYSTEPLPCSLRDALERLPASSILLPRHLRSPEPSSISEEAASPAS